MPRLPQPGGDAGNWGDILNDYLSQAHNPDGTLKDNAVSTPAITNNSISEGKLDAAVRSKLNSGGGVQGATGPKGDQGDAGATGPAGAAGATGPAGTDAEPLIPTNLQSGSYTFVLADAGKAIDVDSASATTVTVPPNASVAFPVGTVIEVCRYGTGTAAGAGVTLRSRDSLTSIAVQYSSVSLRKRATDEWIVVGDLS